MGQTIINAMFLIILICHILKVNYLMQELKDVKRYLEIQAKFCRTLEKAVTSNQEHISKLMDWYKEILEDEID